MPDDLEYMDLPGDPLHITLVFNFVLLKNLDGHFFTSNQVGAQSNFPKSALAQGTT